MATELKSKAGLHVASAWRWSQETRWAACCCCHSCGLLLASTLLLHPAASFQVVPAIGDALPAIRPPKSAIRFHGKPDAAAVCACVCVTHPKRRRRRRRFAARGPNASLKPTNERAGRRENTHQRHRTHVSVISDGPWPRGRRGGGQAQTCTYGVWNRLSQRRATDPVALKESRLTHA